MMRVGGCNAENSQASDGRRARLRKCRDCDNVVRTRRALLCTDCNLRAFDLRQSKAVNTANAARNLRNKFDVVGELSRGLAGLQSSWFSVHGCPFKTGVGQ